MKIAAVGFSCIDTYEKENRRYATGNGVDCVINLSKKGISASVVSVVGTDDFGYEMFSTLEQYKIDTSHLHVREGKTSVFKMELKKNGDRVHLENIPGVMSDFRLDEEDIDFVSKHDFIHTDLAGKILHLLPWFKRSGCKIVFDFSIYIDHENIGEIIKNVDYAFFSYKDKNEFIASFLKYCKRMGPQTVTAMLGENGSITYDGKKFYENGIRAVKVVNTVGAGDAFIAGFVYGIMTGLDIGECQTCGTDTAAEVIQVFNPY
jgi:fructoselysine 6-kinase